MYRRIVPIKCLYGRMKDSGTGREGLRYSIEEMTERKLLLLNLR
jgi:acyl-CoA reductase-like NAD-dependent aldehyde dehydrogenase